METNSEGTREEECLSERQSVFIAPAGSVPGRGEELVKKVGEIMGVQWLK